MTATAQYRKCRECRSTKPLAEFIGKRGGIIQACRKCNAVQIARGTARAKADPARLNAQRRTSVAFALNRIKTQARSRGYAFELAREDAAAMLVGRCTYCGVDRPEGGLNTIDRVDNARGYEPGNCTTACNACNTAKKCLDPRTFVERCRHVSARHGGPGEVHDGCWAPTNPLGVRMAVYKRSAKAKCRAYELTPAEHRALTEDGECRYCGRASDATHCNGIDRVDPGQGYVVQNCVTCCGQCNIAKTDMTHEAFLEFVQRVAAHAPTTGFEHVPRQPLIIAPRKKKKRVA